VLAEHTAADEDLVPRGACIWAHQAAEKAIKALLVARDVDPPKLHDLDRLVAQLPEADAIVFDSLDLPELTRWAIEGRYPADLDEATSADAASSIALARSVMSAVEDRIAGSTR
jgi:HEPN domain-containing protein